MSEVTTRKKDKAPKAKGAETAQLGIDVGVGGEAISTAIRTGQSPQSGRSPVRTTERSAVPVTERVAAGALGEGFGVEEFLRNFETIAEAEGGVNELRQLILILAMQGRLLPQLRDELPPLFALVDGDLTVSEPFQIPENWSWARLGSLAQLDIGRTPPTKSAIYWANGTDGFAWVSIADLNHWGTVTSTKRRVSEEANRTIFRGNIVPKGTLLMSFKLTIGKVSVLGCDAFHNEAIVSIVPRAPELTGYLFRMLPQLAKLGSSKSAIMGSTLNRESLEALMVPVPPLAEQKRIVVKVDALMALCDELEARQAKKRELGARLTGAALGALSSAEGPEEFDAAWARVAESFATVVDRAEKVAEVRRAVLDTLIDCKCRSDGMSTPLSRLLLVPLANGRSVPDGNGFPVLRLSALRNQFVNFEDHKLGDWTSDDADRFVAQENDLLVVRGNGAIRLVGRACIVGNSAIPVAFPDTMIRVRVDPQLVDVFWLWYFWETSNARVQLERKARTTSGIFKVAQDDIASLVVHLPPLAEQKRFVAKVDQLMAICDELEAGLKRAEASAAALAKAGVAAVVG